MINDTKLDKETNKKFDLKMLQLTPGNTIHDPAKYVGHESITNRKPWHNTDGQ